MLKKYKGEFLNAPCPTVFVTSKLADVENVLTVSWTGIASSHPEYVTIAINTKRFSHKIIFESKKFCISIPSYDLIESVDYCGSNSGRDVNKFEACGFTKKYISDYVLIEQCKFHVLCEVINIIELGSHHLFVAKVIDKYLSEDSFDDIHGSLDPIAYFRPFYYRLAAENCGFYGFTKKKSESAVKPIVKN